MLPSLVMCTGFEFGTRAGIATGVAGSRSADGFNDASGIITVEPGGRLGSDYALRVNRSADLAYIYWNTSTIGPTPTSLVGRVWVKFVSGTAGATVTLGDVGIVQSPAQVRAVLRYVVNANQFTMTVGSGSTVTMASTVALDTWAMIEWNYFVNATQYTLDWRVDGVDQTQAVSQTALTASTVDRFVIGEAFAGTSDADIRWDDMALSTTPGDYPLGNGRGILLPVDPAGTVTLNGTAANFNTFSLNGTLAAWDATAARDAVDEVPPTVGAGADGLAQVTLATGDYVELPITSHQIIAGEYIVGARMLACGWAASTSAATVSFHSWNGTTDRTLFATADPAFDNSTTDPGWVAKMLTVADLDQAGLDALAIRVGYSGDATPDIGINTVYVELDVATVLLVRILSAEDGAFTVEKQLDPATDGAVSYVVTTPPGDRGATFNYTLSGTPFSVPVPAGSTATEFVSTVDVSTVSDIELIPDPTPEP